MSEKRKKISRRLIIESDFQYRYTFLICIISGTIFLGFGGVVLYFHQLMYKLVLDEALSQYPGIVDSLKTEFRFLYIGLIASFIVMVGVLFGLGLVLTQRIAGPLLSLKKRLREFAEGQSKVRMNLRKNDEFSNLQDLFNYAMEKNEERLLQIKNDLMSVRSALEGKEIDSALEKITELEKKV